MSEHKKDPLIGMDRRSFLQFSAAATGTAALGLKSQEAQAAPKVKTSVRIVIAGAGSAGLTTANYLADQLEGADITIIDARKAHYYQPGFTLVAAGIKSEKYPTSTTAEYIPKNVKLIEEGVAEFDPDANAVVTNSGQRIEYDYLFVATGMVLNYDAIEGLDTSRIGTNGLGSIYHSPRNAHAT